MVLEVLGEVDNRHAPLTEMALDAVAPFEGFVEAVADIHATGNGGRGAEGGRQARLRRFGRLLPPRKVGGPERRLQA
jgi:hypothetical protein